VKVSDVFRYDLAEILIPEGEILSRVARLSDEIYKDFTGTECGTKLV
jgi:hypothetical protein